MSVAIRRVAYVTCDHVTPKKAGDEACPNVVKIENCESARTALDHAEAHHGWGRWHRVTIGAPQ